MQTTKYVRHSVLGFVLFPDSPDLWHRHVGRWLQASLRGDLLSAGFVEFAGGTCRCFGMSESLSLESRADDSAALAQQLGLQVLMLVAPAPAPALVPAPAPVPTEPGEQRGAWRCGVCGFRGFWSGMHCFNGKPLNADARPSP